MRSIDPTRLAATALAAAIGTLVLGTTPVSEAKHPPSAGKLTEISNSVWVNGKLIHGTRDVFSGNVVKTVQAGKALLELKAAKSTCTTFDEDRLKVAPRPHVVFRLFSGTLICTMLAGRTCPDTVKAGPLTISSCDPLFALSAKKGRTVVKVTRGFVVVSGPHGRRGAVLVGRNRQVVVPAGHDPPAPLPAVLTSRERKALAFLQAKLPANRDSTPPAAKIASAPRRVSGTATATFTFASAERNIAFTCSLDRAPFHLCSSPTSYRGLAPGTHTFAVAATDAAGNTASAGIYSWTIDTRAPIATITTRPPATSSATSATFTFNADESRVSFACQLDGAAFAPCTSPVAYSGLAAGKHTFTVRATDAADNIGPPATIVAWTIDTRAPVVTISSGPAAITKATGATFSFTADKSPVSFACQLDGSAAAPCSSPKTYSGLAQGTHTFLVQATDTVGNVGKTSYTWTIDTTPPRTTITGGPPNPTTATTASFTFTANESGVSFSCKLDGFTAAPCASPKSYGPLSTGQHTFSVTATDRAGNTGNTATYTWTINPPPPA